MEGDMQKRNRFLYILFYFLFIAASLFSRDKIKLAVLDFEGKNISQSSAEAVTDLLRTELFNTGHFKVVERQRIQKIIEEQKFQMMGFTDASQAAEIGRILNVQKIMIGTVTLLGNTHLINTRMVDVQTGLVVLAESVECQGGEDQLPHAITELAIAVSYKVGLEGKIIRIDKEAVYIDVGESDGVKMDQKFDVIRSGEVITDLEGHAIGASEENVGMICVMKVQDRFSIAEIEESSVSLQTGDLVKPRMQTNEKPVKKKEKKEDTTEPDVPMIF